VAQQPPSSSEYPVYVATRMLVEPVECRRIHEPIDGWSWIYCESVGALLRDMVRAVKRGAEPLVMSIRGPVDVLRVEELVEELADPMVEGCFRVHTAVSSSSKLFKLASLVRIKAKPTTIVACFKGVRVSELLSSGIVPLVWEK